MGKRSVPGITTRYTADAMKIDEATYKRMPEQLQRLFTKLPNPASDEVVGLFTERDGGHFPHKRIARTDLQAIYGSGKGQSSTTGTSAHAMGDFGSAARFFKACPLDADERASRLVYCAKASKADRDEGCDGLEEVVASNALARASQLRGEEATCISNAYLPRRNLHPTVKPTALMRYLCRLVTPPGGVVLDPFLGSGSTGKAATQEGFGMVGIEIDEHYFKIARARIEAAMAQLRLPMEMPE